ncbi:MAG: hypothetical protein ABSG98_11715 [Anaerolineales bacterium]|jgi:hypothetical protein
MDRQGVELWVQKGIIPADRHTALAIIAFAVWVFAVREGRQYG